MSFKLAFQSSPGPAFTMCNPASPLSAACQTAWALTMQASLVTLPSRSWGCSTHPLQQPCSIRSALHLDPALTATASRCPCTMSSSCHVMQLDLKTASRAVWGSHTFSQTTPKLCCPLPGLLVLDAHLACLASLLPAKHQSNAWLRAGVSSALQPAHLPQSRLPACPQRLQRCSAGPVPCRGCTTSSSAAGGQSGTACRWAKQHGQWFAVVRGGMLIRT